MTEPTVASLLRTNARFYEAFDALDFEALSELWEHSDRAFCVHPGWNALRGARPVLDSWRRIIENTAAISFTLTHVQARVEGRLGIVTQYETITSRMGSERQTSSAVTTNLYGFEAASGQWRLFHHHAANAVAPPEGDEGLLN
jgi:ketosteroid isomerase-like protein